MIFEIIFAKIQYTFKRGKTWVFKIVNKLVSKSLKT